MPKLYYFWFGFQKYRSSRSRMFFRIGVLKDVHSETPVLEFIFNKVEGLKALDTFL